LYNDHTKYERIVVMQNKNTVDFNESTSPIEFAQLMFQNTDENGTLYLNNWYDVDCEDCQTYNNFVASINWDYKDLENIVSEYSELFEDFKIIAEHYDEFDGTSETAVQILVDEHLVGTYLIYIAPLDTSSPDHLEMDVISRISKGPCGYENIRHAQRLCRLLSLNAPKSVIQNEGRMFIASEILHWQGKKIEKVL
jgi:hypothetical protein